MCSMHKALLQKYLLLMITDSHVVATTSLMVQAFLAEYTKWPMFQKGGGGGRGGGDASPDLSEFMEAREVVQRLSLEYASFEASAHTQVSFVEV